MKSFNQKNLEKFLKEFEQEIHEVETLIKTAKSGGGKESLNDLMEQAGALSAAGAAGAEEVAAGRPVDLPPELQEMSDADLEKHFKAAAGEGKSSDVGESGQTVVEEFEDEDGGDPGTIAAAALAYSIMKGVIDSTDGDIHYKFDRMKGKHFPKSAMEEVPNPDTIGKWRSEKWKLNPLYRSNGFGMWVAGMQVEISWECNGWAFGGVYLKHKEFWDKPGWGAHFEWLVQPLEATKTINGWPVAQCKIICNVSYSRTIGGAISKSYEWVINGAGGGKQL
jgi:hypothetical protein